MKNLLFIILILISFIFNCDNDDFEETHYLKYEVSGNCALVSINNETVCDLNEGEKWIKTYSIDTTDGFYPGHIKIENLTDTSCNIKLDIYDFSDLIYTEENNDPYGVIDYTFKLE